MTLRDYLNIESICQYMYKTFKMVRVKSIGMSVGQEIRQNFLDFVGIGLCGELASD